MKITVIGSGYVGLVSGACLAELGNDVVCLDVDPHKINILNNGGVPIYEPGLEELIKSNIAAGRLRFTTDVAESVAHGLVQMIAVGTPSCEDGSADLQYVIAAARSIGRAMTEYKVIVDKSTVPVGTADKVKQAVQGELNKRNLGSPHTPPLTAEGSLRSSGEPTGVLLAGAMGSREELGRLEGIPQFSVVSNPEFLKEGAAIDDFNRPDRIVIGAEDEHAIKIMREMYAPFQRNHDRLMVMDIKSAELTKYAANAMLATRISFMNELANLAEKVGADIEHVRKGIGSDQRIGYHFLYAGCGYGGSCFPKDISALQRTGEEYGLPLKILHAVEEVNHAQKNVLLQKITRRFGDNLKGKHFALWGLAFKPGTDDMRDATSRVVMEGLWARGATVAAFDPVAMKETHHIYGERAGLRYADNPKDTLHEADALVIVTEWKAFKSPDFGVIKSRLKQPVIFDGRNLFEPADIKALGIEYHGIGR